MAQTGPYEFREARLEDLPEMKWIRDHVRENALVSLRIELPDYEKAIFQDGKAWVCVQNGKVVGFSCARLRQQDVWALFIDREHEGKGMGNRLMELLENWLFVEGCEEITLSTASGTRAEHLYRRRGWLQSRVLDGGEIEFKLRPRNQTSKSKT